MRAVITDVDNFARRAHVLTADGRRLGFGAAEWEGSARPLPGSPVEVELTDGRLTAVRAGDGATLFAGGWPKPDAYLPEDAARSRLSWILFSLDGRLSRGPYAMCLILVLVLAWLALPQLVRLHALADQLAGLVVRSLMESIACALGYFTYYGGWFVLLWLAMAPGVKRLHDINRSGLWMLLPVGSLWLSWLIDVLMRQMGGGSILLLPYGLAVGVMFGFLLMIEAPTPGPNRFGSAPP